jgi:hypothetical protein
MSNDRGEADEGLLEGLWACRRHRLPAKHDIAASSSHRPD